MIARWIRRPYSLAKIMQLDFGFQIYKYPQSHATFGAMGEAVLADW